MPFYAIAARTIERKVFLNIGETVRTEVGLFPLERGGLFDDSEFSFILYFLTIKRKKTQNKQFHLSQECLLHLATNEEFLSPSLSQI